MRDIGAGGLDYKQVVVEFGERIFQEADEGSRAEGTGQRAVWKQGEDRWRQSFSGRERRGREAAGGGTESRAGVEPRDCLADSVENWGGLGQGVSV